MSFSLSSYTPRVFHEYPTLLRQPGDGPPPPEGESTAVLQPPATRLQPPRQRPGSTVPPSGGEPLTVVLQPSAMESVAAASGRIWFAPDQPVELYVVALGSTDLLREQLAGLLDLAGRRRDVAISVGVATAAGLSWVLQRSVPYDIRAMPRYPVPSGRVDVLGALDQARGQILRDAGERSGLKHRALVLIWDGVPLACDAPVDLVVHCAAAPVGLVGALATPQVVLMANRPGARALTHCGRLFEGWQAFERVPSGVTMSRLAAG
jgi:hypothetical protein